MPINIGENASGLTIYSSSTMLALFLAFAFASCATSSYAIASTDPVCIIGAGPGGLTIAHELEAKGYNTVVFEKQPEVGGKCQEYYDGPDQ